MNGEICKEKVRTYACQCNNIVLLTSLGMGCRHVTVWNFPNRGVRSSCRYRSTRLRDYAFLFKSGTKGTLNHYPVIVIRVTATINETQAELSLE